MKIKDYKLVMNGDSAITILFYDCASEQLSKKIQSLAEQFRKHFNALIKEVIPAYQSLTLFFDNQQNSLDKLIKEVELLLSLPFNEGEYTPKKIEIPVCYEGEYSPDLESLALHCKLTINEVIEQHTRETYLVHMLGFLPGFLYLGGLAANLACPRKSTPAISIPEGSVAIGGNQTGIYPVSSPGGWHIIGRTPLNLFNLNSKAPFIANPLDRIQFSAISKDEYLAIKKCLK